MLFPGVRLPLHVFELRYRTMVRDALSGGRMLALATLEPGWEHDYHGSPAFHPHRLPGALRRGGVAAERLLRPAWCWARRACGSAACVREFPYRACEVESCRVTPYDEDDPLTGMERQALAEADAARGRDGAAAWSASPVAGSDAQLRDAREHDRARAARSTRTARLELLALDSVIDRARRLREHLERWSRPPRRAGAEGAGLN